VLTCPGDDHRTNSSEIHRHAGRSVHRSRRAVHWLVANSLIDDDTATRLLDAHPYPDVP
jgi:hypothetical protein